ncbi:hypothetical protein IFM89_003169 [Coptis chinensis]|uniref:RRM domain-containing protein n=1 Tax=Coptis chinensis TaxID=261450 RepID=A0A835I9A2_9MAGN|nr:hypothetical protein IFM89_003169 [Coptis chinensis]
MSMPLRNKMRHKNDLFSKIERMNEDKGGEKVTLYVCFSRPLSKEDNGDELALYKIDPDSEERSEYGHPTRIGVIPLPNNMFSRMNFVALGSKIYLLGVGEYTYPSYHSITNRTIMYVYSPRVFVFDTCSPELGWVEGVPMIGGKTSGSPIVVAFNGKIFVLGYPIGPDDIPIELWGEVFDTAKNSWSHLSNPSPENMHTLSLFTTAHVFNERNKEVLVECYGHGMYGFDLSTQSWKRKPKIIVPRKFSSPGSAKLVVNQVLYVFNDGELYAYDLEAKIGVISSAQVQGLQDAIEDFDPDFTDAFLFYLGNGKLCLVWSVRGFPEKQLLCCLTFGIQVQDHELHAVIHHFDSYIIPGSLLLDCISMVRYLGSLHSMLGYAPLVVWFFLSFLNIVLVDYVEISGTTPWPNVSRDQQSLSLANFFNLFMARIASIDASRERMYDVVLDIYMNSDMNFAIVEVSSVELASNAMALDGVVFEGSPLRIRRPNDYNPWLAAALGPTQPSCFLKLEVVPRQALHRPCKLESSIKYECDILPSRVLCLLKAVLLDIWDDQDSFSQYLRSEAETYGTLKDADSPRLIFNEENSTVVTVFFEYTDIAGSVKAVKGINGRMLKNMRHIAVYYPEEEYLNGDYGYFANLLP